MVGRRQDDEQRPDDRQRDARPENLGPSEAVGEPAEHDDEEARHEGGDRHGEVGDGLVEAERPLDPGDDVQQRLGEQPERDDGEDDAEQPGVAREPTSPGRSGVARRCACDHGYAAGRGAEPGADSRDERFDTGLQRRVG